MTADAQAATPPIPLTNEEQIKVIVEQHGADLSPGKRAEIIETIRCESGFVPQQSKHINKHGEQERSFGIAQIHLPAHPTITYEQAMDIEFATKWTVDRFREGHERWWTCWRQLYSQ